MGSGDWFKTIIRMKKLKNKSFTQKNDASSKIASKSNGAHLKFSEDVAAIMIQTAFRAYLARKVVRRMKGTVRFQKLTQRKSVENQCTSTLTRLHKWSRIQAEIRDRRLCMVIQGRLKQKKLDNQYKLEAKLQDLEVEWNSGANTMEEILVKIHQREEAVVKRERAMAYAFNHQRKANNNQNQNPNPNSSEIGKANWGWSWKERWIAARPWDNRIPPSPSITPNKSTNQKLITSKSAILNLKAFRNTRRMSFPGAVKKPVMKLQEVAVQ